MGCLSIAGTRGAGKTTLARALLARRVRRRSRFLYDPMDEYEASAKVCVSDYRIIGSVIPDAPAEGEVPARVSLRVTCPDDSVEIQTVQGLCRWTEYYAGILGGGPLTPVSVLVIDEAHTVAHTQWCPPELIRQAKKGRHWGVDVWCISQRPVDISPMLRAELDSSECWYLRLVEERDLSALRARRGRDFADRVLYLRDMHALRLLPSKRAPEEWRLEHTDGAPNLIRVA